MFCEKFSIDFYITYKIVKYLQFSFIIFDTIMGIFGSSEENTEVKTIDSSGHVNNNIIIREADDIHSQLDVSSKLLFATYVLIIIEILKLLILSFSGIKRKWKKKYSRNNEAA